MKKNFIAMLLSILIGMTACTENYQSSIDFGDNTYINDYSELAKAINDLSKSLDERLNALNQLLETNLVSIKVSIDAQTNAITTQTTTIKQGADQINTTLLEGFTAIKTAIDSQGDKIITAVNENGELIALHLDQNGTLISAELKATKESLMACIDAINDLNNNIGERLDSLNLLLETNLVAIKVSIDEQTNAIKAQTNTNSGNTQNSTIEQALDLIKTTLLDGFTALKTAIDTQSDKIITAVNQNGELITLHLDQNGQLIVTELKNNSDNLIACMNANTSTLATKLDNINSKLDALNQAISNGFINVTNNQVTSLSNLGTMEQSIQALITEVTNSAQSLLSGITTLNASLDTQTNTLKISLDNVKSEVIQLSAAQTAALTALQTEVATQGGNLEYAILNDETVVVNAIDAMGNLLKSQLITINQNLTAQTSTLNQAIVNNTTAANAIATAVGLTTTEVQNLIQAINTNDAAALAQMQQQNATLANLLSYSDGIILNGNPDANQQYESINISTSVWNEAHNHTEIMTVIENLLAPQGAPTPSRTQYVSSSEDYGQTYTHLHSIWNRKQDNDVVTASSGSVTQNDVTMITVKRVYTTSVFEVTISDECAYPHIYCIKVTDARYTDHKQYNCNGTHPNNTSIPVVVTFTNYYNGTYCPNPSAKVYSTD